MTMVMNMTTITEFTETSESSSLHPTTKIKIFFIKRKATKMKKLISATIATVLLAAMLASCEAGSYECSLCGETFEGKSNKVTRNDVTATFCDDCYELYQLSDELLDEFEE